MALPINIPVLTIEITKIQISDEEPIPTNGYKIILIEDLGYTKLWMEIKIKIN